MKIHRLLIAGLVAVTLFGCKKETVKPQAANTTSNPIVVVPDHPQPINTDAADTMAKHLLGKWNLVKDSTSFSVHQFENSPVTIKQYIGKRADYYDFRADGKCYVSRNGTYDTLAYKVVSNGMVFENNGIVNAVDPLTQHNATITFGMGAIGPGAFFNTETLYLKK